MKAHIQQFLLLAACWVMWLSVDGRTDVSKKEFILDLFRKQDPRRGDIDLSKPGTCPNELVVGDHSPSACVFVCLFDLECPGTQRCCQDDCGGATCIETTENHVANIVEPELDKSTQPPSTVQTDRPTTETAEVTKPETTISTARTTEATTSPINNSGNSDLHLQGDAIVNVSVVDGGDLVLQCDISTSSDEPVFVFWMVLVDRGFRPWSDVPPTGNKRVSHDGAWFEILGATPEDARSFVCFGGYLTGYLTQTYVVTVTEKTGSNSTVAVDPCEQYPSVCQNGASCVRTDHGFTCACAVGWEGLYCQNRTSPCSSNPCLNGGECVDDEGAFQCVCPPEYTGPQCDEEVDVNTEPTGEKTTLAPTTEPMFDVCYLPLDPGSCARKESQWYYDTETEQCRPFVYSGCQGNANRFRSYDECQWECPRLPRDPCLHPIVTGRCKAKIPRWAYSVERETCIEFVYGGCAPTGNNFPTVEECTQTCILDKQQPCEACDVPSLPKAYCNSDFVITGIVRRQMFSNGELKSVVVELTKKYKGRLTLRRSRFLAEPLLITKSRYQQPDNCQSTCREDLKDGKEYVLTGTLTREGGINADAFLTSSSYVRPAIYRRRKKLERLADDVAFNRRCSHRLETPL